MLQAGHQDGNRGLLHQLLRHGRPGFYFRVLEEGEIGAGDAIERISVHPAGMTVRRMSHLLYFEKDDLDGARNALRIQALPPGWRQSFETRLAKAKLSRPAQEKLRTLIVNRKVRETENIASFYLVAEDGKPLATFLPGQFLPLKLDIPGQYRPVLRTYSLSDRPDTGHYRLTIKRETAPPDRPEAYPGVASNYFHDQVDVGSKILAQPPRGRLFLDPSRESPASESMRWARSSADSRRKTTTSTRTSGIAGQGQRTESDVTMTTRVT